MTGTAKDPEPLRVGSRGRHRPNKEGAADPNNNRRSAALEATRTMKRPVRRPSPQGRVAYGGSSLPM